MLQQLNAVAGAVGLKMNYSKTKILSRDQTNITIQNHNIENVEQYVYLGHVITLGKPNQDGEIKRRTLAWGAFGELAHILKNTSISINLMKKVYNTYNIRNAEIRGRTKIRDIVEEITKMKWHWAGHVARYNDNRWIRRIL
ncbi:unnamed protein product, partial [Diabrotica balteata]